MDLIFDYNHPRAKKARYAKKHGNQNFIISIFLASLLFIGGIIPVFFNEPVGYFIWSFIAPIAARIIFIQRYLKSLSMTDNSLAGRLDAVILSKLPQNPTPVDIAKIVQSTNSAQFFAIRFGISTQNLVDLSENEPELSNQIWQMAIHIHSNGRERGETLTGASIVAAILLTQPKLKAILDECQLKEADILVGVEWYEHVLAKMNTHEKQQFNSGIGHDWNRKKMPTLDQFGLNLTDKARSSDLSRGLLSEENLMVVDKIMRELAINKSVNLIGKKGVGKSLVTKALAEQLVDNAIVVPDGVKYFEVVSVDGNSIMRLGEQTIGVIEVVKQIFGELQKTKQKIVLVIENGAELLGMEEVFNYLNGIIGMKIIITTDDHNYKLSTENWTPIEMHQTKENETLVILADEAMKLEKRYKLTFTYLALRQIYKISKKKHKDIGEPGSATVELSLAARSSGGNRIINEDIIKEIL